MCLRGGVVILLEGEFYGGAHGAADVSFDYLIFTYGFCDCVSVFF